MPQLRDDAKERDRLTDEWSQPEFAQRLREADRVVVLFHADWCPFSKAFLDEFERADEESSVPMVRANVRHPMDPRWDDHRVLTVPTAIYFEHGEELERAEAQRGRGLDDRAFARFMHAVESLQERLVERNGRMRVDRFG